MYGLVNKAIESLISKQFGAETWDKVRERAGIDVAGFIGMDPYPDDVTYRLVGAASEVLETPADELLKAFGEFWTLYTADEGYGELLDVSGSTFEEFLANLDEMHARVALSMPSLRPPAFHLDHLEDGRMALHYESERAGLEPMVLGLLNGLAKRFGVQIEVEQQDGDDEDGVHAVFAIRVLQRV